MAKVFGRESTTHPLESALQALNHHSGPGDDDQLAMEWNYRHDWRVSKKREAVFVSTTPPTTAQELLNHHNNYFRNNVRYRRYDLKAPPDFDRPNLNVANSVKSHRKWQLVHILDVGGLGTVFAQAISDPANKSMFHQLSSELRKGPVRFDAGTKELVQVLDRFLHGKRAVEQLQWAKVFIEALASQTGPGKPFHPVWATTLSKFAEAMGPKPTLVNKLRCLLKGSWWNEDEQKQIAREATPERWTALTGVPKVSAAYPAGTWLMLLCYPAQEAGPLYRPTMLDNGWFPQHFPSPRKAGRKGHPMNLRPTEPAQTLIPEFIHPQFKFRPEHFLAIKRLDGPVDCERHDLLAARSAHESLLKSTYGPKLWA